MRSVAGYPACCVPARCMRSGKLFGGNTKSERTRSAQVVDVDQQTNTVAGALHAHLGAGQPGLQTRRREEGCVVLVFVDRFGAWN